MTNQSGLSLGQQIIEWIKESEDGKYTRETLNTHMEILITALHQPEDGDLQGMISSYRRSLGQMLSRGKLITEDADGKIRIVKSPTRRVVAREIVPFLNGTSNGNGTGIKTSSSTSQTDEILVHAWEVASELPAAHTSSLSGVVRVEQSLGSVYAVGVAETYDKVFWFDNPASLQNLVVYVGGNPPDTDFHRVDGRFFVLKLLVNRKVVIRFFPRPKGADIWFKRS